MGKPFKGESGVDFSAEFLGKTIFQNFFRGKFHFFPNFFGGKTSAEFFLKISPEKMSEKSAPHRT
jgi:hypothetical protein